MSKSGRVVAVNLTSGFVAVLIEGSPEHTIFEMLSDRNFDIGDEIYWSDDTGCGHQAYKNKTKGETIEVYVQNHWVHRDILAAQLQMRGGHRIKAAMPYKKMWGLT